MPKTVLNVNLSPNQGKYSFDPVSKLLVWEIGRIESGKSPFVRGTINLQSGSPLPDSNPTILVKFTISQFAISGLKVNRLDMYGEVTVFIVLFATFSSNRLIFLCLEMFLVDKMFTLECAFNVVGKKELLLTFIFFYLQKYKPFKGVKYISKAGNFQVRT